MPEFVIERQHLVPMYQHIVVEAETSKRPARGHRLGTPRRWTATALGERPLLASNWFPTGTTDPRTELIVVTNKEDPSALDMLSFATFLYENDLETVPLLEIPEEFTKEE